jgi:hypothetical protein
MNCCANSADAAWLINSTAILTSYYIQYADLGLCWIGAESCVKLNLVELTGVIPGWSCNGSVDILLAGSCMDMSSSSVTVGTAFCSVSMILSSYYDYIFSNSAASICSDSSAISSFFLFFLIFSISNEVFLVPLDQSCSSFLY